MSQDENKDCSGLDRCKVVMGQNGGANCGRIQIGGANCQSREEELQRNERNLSNCGF